MQKTTNTPKGLSPLRQAINDWHLYILLLPGLAVTLFFRYFPMGGLLIAFQNYNIFKGILNSPWVGLKNFYDVFASYDFGRVLRNTLLISSYKLLFAFPVPIVLALLLKEIANRYFKKTVQTIIYLPPFISWVVIAGILLQFFSPTNGAVNVLREFFGLQPTMTNLLTERPMFRIVLVLTEILKECGWGTIIYLAAFSMVDPNLYEAARVDGAGRFRQIINVTLPCISGVIVILLILNISALMEAGFDQILAMQNDIVREVSDIIDTFVFSKGIQGGRYSYTTAISLFKSLISLALILGADRTAKALGEEGLL